MMQHFCDFKAHEYGHEFIAIGNLEFDAVARMAGIRSCLGSERLMRKTHPGYRAPLQGREQVMLEYPWLAKFQKCGLGSAPDRHAARLQNLNPRIRNQI